MVLTDIRLQHYRSYDDASFELGPGVNIVVGPNAAGKTNLLEAIMVSCVGKSYRLRDAGLLQHGSDWARIDVHTATNGLRTVKLQYDQAGRLQKSFEIDEKALKRLPQTAQQPVVLFEPNNLQLLESEPALRRDYFDNLLEQYVPGYEKLRSNYKRVISQRNALLKQNTPVSSQLFAWNLRLVDLAEQIVTSRLGLAAVINESLSKTYQSIAGEDKKVLLRYDTKIDTSNYSSSLLRKLESSLELDMARGYTGAGPHREDFIVYFGDQPALLSASRGEVRSLLLVLKIIELQVLEAERGVRPLLLLDDVFSELDGARRRALTEFLQDYQVVITTTDADVVLRYFDQLASIVALN